MGSDKSPNILFILADDWGYGDLGCYGNEVIRTPHIDRMALEGIRFTSFYTQTVCGPSRAAPDLLQQLLPGDHLSGVGVQSGSPAAESLFAFSTDK